MDNIKTFQRWVLLIAAGTMFVITGCVENPEQQDGITLGNFPKLFEQDVIIVVGENASSIELDAAKAVEYNLGDISLTRTDVKITGEEKSGYNLVLVGRPDTNKMIRDVYERINVTEVTSESPGAGKGVLEILKNPWNESKVILLVEGSDEWGVRAGSVVLEDEKEFKGNAKVIVDWEEATGVKLPIDNAEEAIKYASTDIRVKEFIKKESALGYKVGTSAIFSNTTDNPYARFLNGTNNWWIVKYNALPLTSFTIYISPNGTIIFGGVAS